MRLKCRYILNVSPIRLYVLSSFDYQKTWNRARLIHHNDNDGFVLSCGPHCGLL